MNNRNSKINFDQFEEMVFYHQSKLTDIKMNLSDIVYKPNGKVIINEVDPLFGSKYQTVSIANDVGFTGLCERLGAPKAWLTSNKCPEDLEETIIMRLAKEHEGSKDSLLRLRGMGDYQVLRAVLSDQYLAYNHYDLWTDVKNAIIGTKLEGLNPIIWKPSVSDTMDAWILFESVVADPENDNIRLYDGGGAGGLKPAIHIRNSEDGTGKVKVESGLYRSYCTNGVIFGFTNNNRISAVHRGNSKHWLSTNVALAVAGAARDCGIGISKFIETTHQKIRAEVVNDIVDDWAKKYNIAVGTVEDWKASLYNIESVGDFVMATADFAGTRGDREEVTTMETMAGDMLFANFWKHQA